MTLRELVAKFGLNFDRSSFDRADARVESLKKAAAGLAVAFAGSKVVRWSQRMVDATAQAGDQLGILSARTGIGVGAIQELQHAAALAGASTEETNASLQTFTRTIGLAANGNKAAAQAFARLGVRVRDASGRVRAGDEVLMDLADGLARLPSDAHQAEAAMALMGRGGIRMAAALKGGSAALGAARQEARDLGLMSEDTVQAAADMVANQIRFRRATIALRDQIVGRLLPAMNETIPKVLAWMKANRELIAQRVEQAVRVITAAMVGLSNIGNAVVDVVRRISDAFGGATATAAKLALFVGALVALFGVKAVAIGLLVALVEDFIGALQGKESLLDRIALAIRESIFTILSNDVSYADAPLLAFLRDVVSVATKAAMALGTVVDLISGASWSEAKQPWEDLHMEVVRRQAAGESARLSRMREDELARQSGGGLMSAPVVTPSPAASVAMSSPVVHQSLSVQIDGSNLSGDELQSRIERAVGKANREAFTAAVPAIAGSGW